MRNRDLASCLQLGDFQYDTSMVFVAVFMLVALALVVWRSDFAWKDDF
jgi:hypothetical protein